MKYLFLVEYKDGTIYQQNEQDVSETDPKRSCYFDVKQEEVKKFFLIGADNIFCVDMEDGHFEVNKTAFYLHDKAEPLINRRLIFFRQHTHNFNAETKQELSHEIMFQFGWQANDLSGKNIQHIIEVL